MGHEQYQQMIKRLPTLLIGAFGGVVLMCGVSRFPVLIEVDWGVEESRVKFDSRTENMCEAISVNTY